MKRSALATTALLLALVWPSRASADEYEKRTRVVKITPLYKGNPSGVGFFVTPTVIATARHVLYPDCSALGRPLPNCPDERPAVDEYTLQFENQTPVSIKLGTDATIFDTSVDVDVAFLRLTTPFPTISGFGPASTPDDDDLLDGTGLIVPIGGAKSAPIQVPRASFQSQFAGSHMVKRVPLECSGIPSDSGAPIYSRLYGRIVGVYTEEMNDTKERRLMGVGTSLGDPQVVKALEGAGVSLDRLDIHAPRNNDVFHVSMWAGVAWPLDRSLDTSLPMVEGAAQLSFELPFASRTWSIGASGGPALSATRYRYSFLSPGKEIELRDRLPNGKRLDTLIGVGGEAALEARFWRLSQHSLVVQVGGRILVPVVYEPPKDVERDVLMGSLFVSGRILLGSPKRSGPRFAFQVRPSIEWLPTSRYRFTGLDGVVEPAGETRGYSISTGAGCEFF